MERTKAYLESLSVSFYRHVSERKYMDMPISRVLKGIREECYLNTIIHARSLLERNDKDGYRDVKNSLPAVTFCGTFSSGHAAADYLTYNRLLVLDIDKLDEGEMTRIEPILSKLPFIAAYWLSPSGRGYKGLVHLEYPFDLPSDSTELKECHKKAFSQVFMYLLTEYGIPLDASGSDICRLCYMSSDSSLVVKEVATPFVVDEEEVLADSKRKETVSSRTEPASSVDWNVICGRANQYAHHGSNSDLLLYIYKKLKQRNLSITGDWASWVKVAYAIASSIHPVKGRELFLKLCRLDGTRHDEVKSDRLIKEAYSRNLGRCSMSSIIYLAKEQGIALNR